MNTNTNSCPTCGKPLPADAPMGICPDCLLDAGFGTVTADVEKLRAFEPPPPEELAAKFPQLEILALLGRGGMGAVYKARQKRLDRVVALKILPPGIGEGAAFAARFEREAKALAKLHHPHIVTLYEFGEADGLFYFLMEFVDGVTLRHLLGAGVAPREALAIVPQICDALQFAHDRGIVHRDIKPENILLNKEGQVKIADFGVAKIVAEAGETAGSADAGATLQTQASVLGTPSYMAPEQIAHPGEVDHRADIYALGVVFYQMLTGELPAKRIEPPSRKVQIDVRLDEVVLRALEKNPEQRYAQASIFKTQVETIAMDLGSARASRAASGAPAEKIADQPGEAADQNGAARVGDESSARAQTTAREARALPEEPRFSRTAIVGACWPFFVFAILVLVASPLTGLDTDRAIELAITLSFIGTTNFGWIAVSQIRRSAGRLHGMWLAVLDGLLPPLLALDGFIGAALYKRVGIEKIANTLTGQLGPGKDATFYVTVYNSLVLLTLAAVIFVNVLIARKVWRAVHSPWQSDVKPLAYTALFFGALSNLIPMIFYWNANALPWITPQIQQAMLGLTLVVAALAVILGNLSRASRAGWTALVLGGISLTIWMLCFISGMISERNHATNFAPAAAAPQSEAERETSDETVLAEYDWSKIPRRDNPLCALVDGRWAAKIENASDAPLQKLLLKIEKPPITAKRYAVTGEIKYADVQGAGYLEMWSVFKSGKFFTRTMGAPGSGPMAQIAGASDWRAFSLPFDSTGATGAPTQLELNIFLPKRGVVYIGPLKLVQFADAKETAAMLAVTAWLALEDEGKYAESWQQAADDFRSAVRRDDWMAQSEKIRKELGTLISRQRSSAQETESLPGMRAGKYFVAKFDSSFSEEKSAKETVTFELEKDGRWRAAGYFVRPIADTENGKAAVTAAENWLTGIDSENYAESWRDADAFFQKALTSEAWSAALANVRKPLGSLLSRELRASRETKSLPGAPDGEYVIMEFDTSFSEKKSAPEVVTFSHGLDGKWRAAGYFIK